MSDEKMSIGEAVAKLAELVMKRLAAALLIAATAACTPVQNSAPARVPPTTAVTNGTPVTITRVIDGDTVVATGARDHAQVIVRILGIDTPETKDPRKPVQCWGPEASEYAKKTLLGQQVTLVADPTQDATGRYGRTLAYVKLGDGRDYSIEAARAGMARSYVYDRHPVIEYAAIAAAEREARDAHRGLWGACGK